MSWLGGGVTEEDRLDMTATRAVLARALRMVGQYRASAIRAMVLLVLWTGTILAGPMLVGRAIDSGIRAGDRGALNISVVAYLVVAITGYLLYRGAIISLAKVGENFLRDLRRRVFDRLLNQSMSFYDREKPGVLVSRMTSDIDSLGELVQFGLLMFTSAALQLIGTTVALTFLSWKLMAVCLVSIPLVGLASVKFQRDSNRAFLDVRDRIGTTLSALQEGISGVRVVQAYAREDVEGRTIQAHQQRPVPVTHGVGARRVLVFAGHRGGGHAHYWRRYRFRRLVRSRRRPIDRYCGCIRVAAPRFVRAGAAVESAL